MRIAPSRSLLCLALALGGTTGRPAFAQAITAGDPPASVSSSLQDLPDAPQDAASKEKADRATANQAAAGAHQDLQTKRILGIIPNFRAVSADIELPPQSVKEKFFTATQDSFDYSTILLPALTAGYAMATDATPEFHQGAAGYARYLWHSYVDQASENFFVEAIGPAITHQDNRYYTLGKGGFVKRTAYSLSRVLITRDDAGKEVFNSSEVIGAAAAAGLSNLYYPERERTFGSTAGKWSQSIGIDAFTFMSKEFWPDINHHLFHGKGGGGSQ